MTENVIQLPPLGTKPNDVLEFAKGYDFETVFIVGHTKEGGSAEGGAVVSLGHKNNKEMTAKDLLFLSELCRYMALKQLGYE
jgi:hypothetical protein